MFYRIRPLIFILSLFTTALTAQTYTNQITIPSGEEWWGLSATENLTQPFETNFKLNTANQVAHPLSSQMMISNFGRYIADTTPFEVEFDTKQFTITSTNASLDVARGGKTLREAYLVCVHKYFPLSGAEPDEALFRTPVYNLSELASHQNRDLVEQTADRILAEGLPAGILLFPSGWQSNNSGMDFDSQLYPDAAAMIDRLHSKGFKVMLPVTPYLPAAGITYLQYRKQQMLITDQHNKPLIFESDMGYMAAMKPSEELATKINTALLELKSHCRVDGFKLDCGDVVSSLADTPQQASDYISFWRSTCKGLGMVILSHGSQDQSEPLTVTSDIDGQPTWNKLERLVATNAIAGLLGYRYLTVNCPTTDHIESSLLQSLLLIMATTPVATIPYPMEQCTDRTVLKEIVAWRTKASDYIAQLSRESATTGEPIIRTLEYQFPKSGFANCQDQFMIGSRWLVAPVLTDDNNRMVRLPRGTWISPEGKRIKGPRVLNYSASANRPAIFELQ